MSFKREVVRDTAPIGVRAWMHCDGCGQRGPVAERKLEVGEHPDNPTCGPHLHRIKGWAILALIADESSYAVCPGVDLCPKCQGLRVDDALERAAK